jgi:molybdopterin-guanine dinucleotide biosynthesis protein A
MGVSKPMLPFGPERMLQRVVRLLGEVVQPLVVVAAQDQPLPSLPPDVAIIRDRQRGRGPLEGLRAGLAALAADVEAAYATGCDVPLLQAAFVQRMIDSLTHHQISVPVDRQFYHPLAAVYRTELVSRIEQLLADGGTKPRILFDEVPTVCVPVERLREVDPRLDTLANLNWPEDYANALSLAGFDRVGDIA